ncbi:MAG: AAA family ATPase [Pseudomonadota bacterium]
MATQQKHPAEMTFADELRALAEHDTGPVPTGWSMGPQSVVTYLMGGKAGDGTVISPKYIGDRRLMETAVASLATDRALLLLGVPGTAKSWVSEHMTAAISGDSTMMIQCTAGTDENQIRYSWNYAELLAKGPSTDALVPTPLFRAMEQGKICRLEELTRMGSDVQDTLITVLSEKLIPVPELNTSQYAAQGFNVIATANNKDKGVNDLSSALKRRFNVVVLPLPASLKEEIQIVDKRVAEASSDLKLGVPKNAQDEITRVLEIFRELRDGESRDGKVKLKELSSSLSTAEAIGVVVGSISHAHYFDGGRLSAEALAPQMLGAIIKDPQQDKKVLEEYLETVLKKRFDDRDLYSALTSMM